LGNHDLRQSLARILCGCVEDAVEIQQLDRVEVEETDVLDSHPG